MTDPGEQRPTNSTQDSNRAADTDSGIGRRGFLRTSAAAVSFAGLGVAGGKPLHSSTGAAIQDPPSYLDFVPADDQFTDESGAISFTNAEMQPALEFLSVAESGEQNDDEPSPFQFEPFTLFTLLVGFEFSRLQSLGLGDAIPIVSTTDEEFPEGDIPDFPTDRVTGVGDVVVTSGSYDAEEIAAAIEESELTESDTSGVFVGPAPLQGSQASSIAVTWSSEYIITGPSVELVVAVQEAAQGQTPRLYEQNDDIARQVDDAGQGPLVMTAFSTEGTLDIDVADGFVDYSAIVDSQVQGYTHSLSFETEPVSITATTVFSHPSADAVDESSLSGIGAEAEQSTLSRDGRFVTVESVYSGLQPGDDDGSGDDGSGDGGSGDDGSGDGGSGDDGSGDGGSGDDGSGDGGSGDGGSGDGGSGDGGSGDGGSGDDGSGDGGSGDGGSGDGGSGDGGSGDDGSGDDGSGDGGGSGDDGSGDDGSGDDGSGDDGSGDDSGSGDGSGPGFGLLSALAGLGGASYLLSRRRSETTGLDDEQ